MKLKFWQKRILKDPRKAQGFSDLKKSQRHINAMRRIYKGLFTFRLIHKPYKGRKIHVVVSEKE